MTWIKICGTTNLEDALSCVDAGADALGFVFYEASPRNVAPEAVRKIVDRIPPAIETVGVFVNESAEFIEDVAARSGLTAFQIYRELPEVSPRSTPLKKFAVVREHQIAGFREQLRSLSANARGTSPPACCDAIFLDSGSADRPGGTGKQFDWGKSELLAEDIRRAGFKLVVAGGLHAGNVGEAIRILKPWGVDVVSGVEASPGKKDPRKVRAFINAVRQGVT